MSGLVNVDNLCKNPENHKSHICELKKADQAEKIAELQNYPKFICNNCGEKTNQQGAVCAPGPYHN